MNSRIKQYILIAVAAAVGYFIMSNHIIFNGSEVHLLKKNELHLHYTFYSVKQKKPSVIMEIDYLRDAGIGDLLVEMEIISEEEKSRLESKYY
jgi:hypothetical protein